MPALSYLSHLRSPPRLPTASLHVTRQACHLTTESSTSTFYPVYSSSSALTARCFRSLLHHSNQLLLRSGLPRQAWLLDSFRGFLLLPVSLGLASLSFCNGCSVPSMAHHPGLDRRRSLFFFPFVHGVWHRMDIYPTAAAAYMRASS